MKKKFISTVAIVMAMVMTLGLTAFAAGSPKPTPKPSTNTESSSDDSGSGAGSYSAPYDEEEAKDHPPVSLSVDWRKYINTVPTGANGKPVETKTQIYIQNGNAISADFASMKTLKAAYEAMFPGEEYYGSFAVTTLTAIMIKAGKAVQGKVKINFAGPNGVFGTLSPDQIIVTGDGSLTIAAQPGYCYAITFIK